MRLEGEMSRFNAVLCRAEGSANIGAACRAIKSMGCSSLTLVNCPDFDEITVRTHALAAWDVYEAARRFDNLDEALADVSLTAGFTRRLGKKRKESVPVNEFAQRIANSDGPVALVFGNERDGLSDSELAHCDLAVHIPSSAMFPSLNLSHAIQLAFWELRRNVLGHREDTHGYRSRRMTATREEIRARASVMADDLATAGFFKIRGRAEKEDFIAEVAARASLTKAELKRYEMLFRKLAALKSRRP
ncbi:MAG: RNA methyltransferase [Spirochaetales bacterium]|nr:MAG: RNA methyltransferase [Spirochaetales bacterium]